jgi:NADP-dependent 3-hydroxy acid dehydrogenase YdfG
MTIHPATRSAPSPPGARPRSPFAGRVAVVTGAASGIGRALCLALCESGAIVIGADRDAEGLVALRAEAESGTLTTATLDVTDRAAVGDVLDGVVAVHGRLDLVFNNAGIVVGGDYEDMDVHAWEKIVDVNLWGVIHGTDRAYRIMLEQGHGHIVNTASTAGVLPVARSTAYATTKHAVVGLSVSLREEARANGIRVSVVIPGLVDTNIFDTATNIGGHDYRAAIDRVPLGRLSPARAADHILRGVRRNRSHIVFPASNRAIVAAYRLAPRIMGRIVNQQT